jgi:uncharacterized phage-associated protein
MSTNAIAVANYFIDLAAENSKEIRQFGLMKRVYITHGFTLALFDRPAIDPQFDYVEAWKNGPVIPSVYHSFKQNGNKGITEKSFIVDFENGNFKMEEPTLTDEDIQAVANSVWDMYLDMDDRKLIELLHRPGTPWALCYVEGQNNKIPDLYTKVFYKKYIKYGKRKEN